MALFGFKKRKEEKEVPTSEGVGIPTSDKGQSVGEKTATPEVVTKEPPKKEKEKKDAATPAVLRGDSTLEGVLLRPRITEKATFASSAGVYVFEVKADVTKQQVKKAIQRFYDVTPRKINMTKIVPKRVRSSMRRQYGVVSGGKKAYVYLKEGDTIEIV